MPGYALERLDNTCENILEIHFYDIKTIKCF